MSLSLQISSDNMRNVETRIVDLPEGKLMYKVEFPKNTHYGRDCKTLLFFIHAAVADNTMWDEQVEFLVDKGYSCARCDLLGFGQSPANLDYFKDPNNKTNHVKNLISLLKKEKLNSLADNVVVVGLSMGGGLALRMAVEDPAIVSGAVVAAGSVPGYDPGVDDAAEMKLDADIETAVDQGDIKNAAKMQVHYWGDGPLQSPGRISGALQQRLYDWCFENASRQYHKTGGFALPSARRSEINETTLKSLSMPFAVGIGDYDETWTNTTMEYLARSVNDCDLRRFKTAHMINLEESNEFNEWLYNWLQQKFPISK